MTGIPKYNLHDETHAALKWGYLCFTLWLKAHLKCLLWSRRRSSEEEHRLVSASATPTRLGVLAENSSAHNLGHNSFYSVFSDSLWQWFSSITIWTNTSFQRLVLLRALLCPRDLLWPWTPPPSHMLRPNLSPADLSSCTDYSSNTCVS